MPRVKVPSLVITFPTTAAAMACEKLCHEQNLPGRIIPVPGDIQAGCGLAWKVDPTAEQLLKEALSNAGVSWEAMHIVPLYVFIKAQEGEKEVEK